MIAITKEFKQMLQEMFKSRGVTEILANDLVEILAVSFKELEMMLKEENLSKEFRLVKAEDGTIYVKRYMQPLLDGKSMTIAFKIQWDNIGGCPCFTCYELEKCDVGNPISSVDCPLFSRWLFSDSEKEKKK